MVEKWWNSSSGDKGDQFWGLRQYCLRIRQTGVALEGFTGANGIGHGARGSGVLAARGLRGKADEGTVKSR